MLSTFNEIDMTNIMAMRSQYKDAFLEKHGVKLGFMSAFVKAAASALELVPAVNAVIDNNEIVYRDYVDISIAVATPKGLVVPVLRDVGDLRFADVEKVRCLPGCTCTARALPPQCCLPSCTCTARVLPPQCCLPGCTWAACAACPVDKRRHATAVHSRAPLHHRAAAAPPRRCSTTAPLLRDRTTAAPPRRVQTIVGLGKKARDGALSIDEMSGGTFTISNGGVYGSLLSTPIINPPQSAILGMHSIQQRPMVVNGEIKARPMMYIALTYDHRLIDGREVRRLPAVFADDVHCARVLPLPIMCQTCAPPPNIGTHARRVFSSISSPIGSNIKL